MNPQAELTLRGVLLGAVITLVFTAANVYFGLKAGLTFASSIPAAVISMALLRGFRDVTIQENNIVQTIASAAGTLSSIIFVLPGLIMVGWWNGFPYWATFSVCALGGVLGVMYSIPLRRALVTHSDLPYPEGVACAEVLKVGSGGDASDAQTAVESGRAGLFAIVVGSVVSAAFAMVIATRLFAANVASFFRVGSTGAITGFDLSLSLALFGVGHLVGLWVGVAMFIGVLIAWAGAVPILTMLHPATGDAAQLAQAAWGHHVRFIGAGAIGVAAIWTLLKLARPVVNGLRSAIAASRLRASGHSAGLARTELDIPISIVAGITVLCLIPIGWLLADFASGGGVDALKPALVIGGLVFIAVMSALVSAVCGYMAGLIGSSNSPLSGVGILVVILASLLILLVIKPLAGPAAGPTLVAFALFATSLVFAVATIANDNLQDLKTGQLVDATPWKQQVALIIGVIAGAAVIPPILDLLNQAYGLAGAPGVDAARALPAPQAALISALAKGVIQGQLDWNLIGIGVAIGAGIIAFDELLALRKGARLPPLAVGMGIYLPMSTTLVIVLGAIVGWAYERRSDRGRDPQAAKQLGVLLASGLIVGESLIGVLLAAIVVFSGQATPLALVGDSFNDASLYLGGFALAATLAALYFWLGRLNATRNSR